MLYVEWQRKHSNATPFHDRSVAHVDVFVGASYPIGPPMSREEFVMTLFLSARTTRRLNCSRVIPDGHAPDSKWSTSAAAEINALLQSSPGHLKLLCW